MRVSYKMPKGGSLLILNSADETISKQVFAQILLLQKELKKNDKCIAIIKQILEMIQDTGPKIKDEVISLIMKQLICN